MSGHPDAALLALCAELHRLQEEWQRLWTATPDDGEDTPADHAWQRYSDWIWPGNQGAGEAGDRVRLLLELRATTPEGRQAKAAAVLAVEEASAYGPPSEGGLGQPRVDSYALMHSVLRDVAGDARMVMGEPDAEEGR